MTIITVEVRLTHRYLMKRSKSKLWELLHDYRDAVTRHEGKPPMDYMALPKDLSKHELSTRILRLAERLPE